MGYSTDCIKTLNTWIVEIKRKEYMKNNSDNSDNSEGSENLEFYRSNLEELEGKLKPAIEREDKVALEKCGWPSQLMECIKDMNIRSQILDCLNQAFVIHPFNRSPKHQEELEKQSAGLR